MTFLQNSLVCEFLWQDPSNNIFLALLYKNYQQVFSQIQIIADFLAIFFKFFGKNIYCQISLFQKFYFLVKISCRFFFKFFLQIFYELFLSKFSLNFYLAGFFTNIDYCRFFGNFFLFFGKNIYFQISLFQKFYFLVKISCRFFFSNFSYRFFTNYFFRNFL